MSKTIILLRTRWVDQNTTEFAQELAEASGHEVALVVDERLAEQPSSTFTKISLNHESYESLGLYIPADVAWKCGDYGLYLARRRFPDAERFWMFEDDVRISGSAQRFFSELTEPDHDLLVGWLEKAEPPWYWVSYAAARDAKPFACRFPVVRLSARTLDLLYRKRLAHSRRLNRRRLWPNDETFVATTVMNSDLTAADFNDLGTPYYDRSTFNVTGLFTGPVGSSGPPRLLHPVLRRDRPIAEAANPRYQVRDPFSMRAERAAIRRMNKWLAW